MNFLLTILLAVQMIAAIGMIGLILVQHGKGADMGAAFGSGSSGSQWQRELFVPHHRCSGRRVFRLHPGARLFQ